MSTLKKVSFILIALTFLVAQSAILVSPAYAAPSAIRIYAKEVEEDKSVTLVGMNLQTKTRYSVYLSRVGKYPASAILVGYAVTDNNGAFTKAFKIPGKLVDVARISINIVSARGDTASNWFINASSTSNILGEGSPAFIFWVTAHQKGDWVQLRTNNLPARVTFDVRMGKAGSQGINGIKVGVLRSNQGGTVMATFAIPDALAGKPKLDLRLENKALGIAFYVTFRNQ